MNNFSRILVAFSVLLLSACQNTSLSNPGGSGHGEDLSMYELAGLDPAKGVSEADIHTARGRRLAAPPAKGTRILLVQSGAYQPDESLQKAFAPFCDIVRWDGRSEPTATSRTDKSAPKSPGSAGRRLRLVAAQQGCTHVIVVFGEIQSDSKPFPTDALSGWVPIVGELIPSAQSGSRLYTQAMILETGSPRSRLVAADVREASSITSNTSENSAKIRHAEKLKAKTYPELAARCFQ